MFNNKILNAGLFITLLTVLMNSVVSADSNQDKIGEVVFAKGAVSAKSKDGAIRVLGKAFPIYQGDIITTGSKSFSVIKMIDDSRISIRPNTVFSFEDYSFNKGRDSAVMRLFKGGLRAISGLISKRNPEVFKLNTSVATIGIRGTEFDARLCGADCTVEKHERKKVTVAKVAFMKGEAYSTSKDGIETKLKTGGSLYEGDLIETKIKSFVVLVFKDKGRVTLKENTQFKIEQHKYIVNKPEESNAIFRLIKGGMRALTGLIGKKNKKSYKVRTPTATIGIRGTGYDLVWAGPCSGGVSSCGLSASVWLGSIYAENNSGTFELNQNESFLLKSSSATPLPIAVPPIPDAPRPDSIDVNEAELFSEEAEDVPTGLYVHTREGEVYMERDGDEITIRPGETGLAPYDSPILEKVNIELDLVPISPGSPVGGGAYPLPDDGPVGGGDWCTI